MRPTAHTEWSRSGAAPSTTVLRVVGMGSGVHAEPVQCSDSGCAISANSGSAQPTAMASCVANATTPVTAALAPPGGFVDANDDAPGPAGVDGERVLPPPGRPLVAPLPPGRADHP